jgi:hypothetical protein
MASFAKNGRIIKNLTPEQACRGLAEWCAVMAGIDLDGRCKVSVIHQFDKDTKKMLGVRVEVERA